MQKCEMTFPDAPPPPPIPKPNTSNLTSNTQTPLIDAEKLDYLESKHQVSRSWKHQLMSILQGAFLHFRRLLMLSRGTALRDEPTARATTRKPHPTTPIHPAHR